MLYGGGGDDHFVLGLHEDALIWDTQGRNTLTFEGADPAKLAGALSGRNLVLSYDGQQVATVVDWVGQKSHYAGIDLGGTAGTRTLDSLLPGGSAAAAPRDLLADYMPDGAAAGGAQVRMSSPLPAASGSGHHAGAAAGGPADAWVAGALDHGFAAGGDEPYEEARHHHGQGGGAGHG